MATIPEQSSKPSGNWCQLLKDKIVFVTSAGGGIGSAIAHTCALHGARVVVADINKAAADEVVAKIINEDKTKKDCVISIELDVSNEQAVENAVKIVVDKWTTIDVLFNKYVNRLESCLITFCLFLVLVFLPLAQLILYQPKPGHIY
jgi:ornithine carbamoyltransferase